jgi:hypothetical protein
MKTKQKLMRWGIMAFLILTFLTGMAQPYPNQGNQSVCLNSVQPYGVVNTPGSTYAWSIIPITTGNGTIQSGQGTNLITVDWTSVGTCTLQVIETLASGCVGLPVTITITVNPLPVPTITGPTPVCQNSTGNVYTTQAGMTGYVWNVAGGTITAGGTATDNTVTVTWTTVGTETVSVNYTDANGCTAANPTVYNVVVNPLPVPTITGPTPVCQNSAGNVYTTEANMTNYVWAVVGGTITAGGTATDNTVTITWTTVGAETVSVNYNNANGCSAGTATVFNVTVNALPVPTITGPTPVCQNSTGNVYTTEANMTNYIWAVVGGTITAGGTATDNTVTVTWTTVGTESVSVNYTNGTSCTAAEPTVFNVIVNALPVPTINGPTPVCQNSTGNVYTTEANMTNYVWNVVGGTITAGGTGTDNTVTVTWTTVGTETLSVNYTDADGCTAASPTVFNVTVHALPVPTIAGPTPVCQNSTGNIYTTQPGMTNYVWAVVGGTITAGGTGTDNTVTVTWTTVGTETVSVDYNDANGCTAANPTVFNVIVNALPVPTITGPTPVCQNSTGNVYTTEANMTNYIWAVVGGTITAGGTGTDNTVTVTWTTVGTESVSVDYTNGTSCNAANPTVFNVTVHALPVPTITGPTPVCQNSTGNVYTTQPGMTNYVWAVVGGTITAGGTATDNTVTVTWTTVGTETVSVDYHDANGCTAANPTVFNVIVHALPVPTITGPTPVCQNSTGNVYTTEASMSNYVWVVIGGTITSGQGTNSITVTWTTVGTETVSVNYNDANGCTAATPTVYNVTVNALPVPTITGPTPVCLNSSGNIYTTESGMTNYTWTITGGTINSGQGTNSISVTWTATGNQTLTITYTDINGCNPLVPTQKTIVVEVLPNTSPIYHN